MTRTEALPYVAHLLTDALGELPLDKLLPDARLVGWQCGFEPHVVAVQSYLPNTKIDDDEAVEIATDFLAEKHWFVAEPTEPDFVI